MQNFLEIIKLIRVEEDNFSRFIVKERCVFAAYFKQHAHKEQNVKHEYIPTNTKK